MHAEIDIVYAIYETKRVRASTLSNVDIDGVWLVHGRGVQGMERRENGLERCAQTGEGTSDGRLCHARRTCWMRSQMNVLEWVWKVRESDRNELKEKRVYKIRSRLSPSSSAFFYLTFTHFYDYLSHSTSPCKKWLEKQSVLIWVPLTRKCSLGP
jgi:hypothetical protein